MTEPAECDLFRQTRTYENYDEQIFVPAYDFKYKCEHMFDPLWEQILLLNLTPLQAVK